MSTINLTNQTPHKHGRLSYGSIQIIKAQNRQERNTFIRLPRLLYRDDPVWVPPLLLERRMHLSPKNPYFEHASCCFWIAYRDGKPVGRISAQIDRLHLERYHDHTGFWGMLESENNIETFQALLNTAENWLRSHGMMRARGPFSLSINQECGLLVEGFNTPPSIMMGHARPYYGSHIEQCGYRKAVDLLAYIIDVNFKHSAAMQTVIKRAKSRVQTRTLRKSHFQEDMNIILSIFNDAWSKNWGFIPFTQKEFEHLGKDLKLLVDEELVSIAEVDGIPAAFMILLPNLNEVIHDLNGRLLPFGWLKILHRLKVKHPTTARIPLMGIRRQYHDSLLGAMLAYSVITALQEPAVKRGIKQVELSWILEDNKGMRNIIEDIGGSVYKTYRIYTKDL
jgi:hypothetical protein